MNCEYCAHKLSDSKSLEKHQKYTKFCLEKQKEIKQLNEIELLKTQLIEKDNEIESLKKQLNEKDNKKNDDKNYNFDDIQNIIKEYCKNN